MFMNPVCVRTVVAFALIAASAWGQAPAQVQTRRFDLSSINFGVASRSLPKWSLPIRRSYEEFDDGVIRRPEGDGDLEPRSFAMEDLTSFIAQSIAPDSWASQSNSGMEINGSYLSVTQTPEVLDRVEEFIRYIGDVVHRSVSLDVLVVRTDHATVTELAQESGAIAATRFNALLSGKDQGMVVVSAAAAIAESGQRQRMRTGRVLQFIGDYDVEVAQSAQIPDPRLQSIAEGLDVGVRAWVLHDGRIALRFQGEYTSGLEFQKVVPGAINIGQIMLPRGNVTMVDGSVVLESGNGIAVGVIGSDAGSRHLLVLRATARAKRPQPVSGKESCRAYDLGYLTQSRMILRQLSLGSTNGDVRVNGEVNRLEEEISGLELFDADQIMEMIRRYIQEGDDDEDGVHHWDHFENGRAWVMANTDQHRRIEEMLDGLVAERSRSIALEYYVVTAKRAQVAQYRSEAPEEWIRRLLKAPETTRLSSGLAVTESGGRFDLLCGREFAYVSDLQVEIAQAASISDPQVDVGFSGTYLQVQALAGPGSKVLLHYTAEMANSAMDQVATLDLQVPEQGRLQVPEADGHLISGDVWTESKEYIVLGERSAGKSGEDIVLTICRPFVTASKGR